VISLPTQLKQFASRYASFAGARIALVVSRWFVLIQSARHLTPIEFGVLAAALSASEITRALGDLGVDSFVYSRLGGPNSPLSPCVRTAILLRAVTSVLLLFIAVYIWNAIALPINVSTVFLLIFAVPTQSTAVAMLQKAAAFRSLMLLIGITFVASLTVDAVALANPKSLGLMALLLVSADLVAAFAALALAAPMIAQLFRAASKRRRSVWKIIQPSMGRLLPSALIAVIVMVYGRIDVVIVRPLLGANAQADFSAGFRLIEPFFLIFAIGALALLAELAGRTRDSSQKIANHILRASPVFITVALAAFGMMCATITDLVAAHLLGLTKQAALVAALLASAIPFRIANTLITTLLQKFGRFDLVLVAAALNCTFIIGLSLILHRAIGFSGIAGSTVCSELITLFVLRRILAFQQSLQNRNRSSTT